jgi:hypothetical protein
VSDSNEVEPSDNMSVDEMRRWLAQELKDVDKARELRTKEATGFVEAYARGELTPDAASDRLMAYEDRWGEPLGVASALPHLSDEEILAIMDRGRAEAQSRMRLAQHRLRTQPYSREPPSGSKR